MIKVLFALVLSVFATAAFAAPTNCSCTQNFEDFLGYESEITVHVNCPEAPRESLDCASDITHNEFSAMCTDTDSGVSNTTTIKLDPGSKPQYGYTYCRLN